MSAFAESMARLLRGEDLPRAQAEQVMDDCMGGALEAPQIAALLTALAAKGVRSAELAGFAAAMRRAATPVRSGGGLVDTCGTGGSGLPTTNTSTLCAFVLAAAGVPVAKHGNRASSGRCGSMDVLEELGVAIELGPEQAEELLADQGIAFLFAPLYHPAMRHVAPVRRSLGFRTVFNFLGPLCNPAGARRQLLGVSDPSMAPRMARALAGLDSERVLVVWGEDGLDELSLGAPTRTWELVDGELLEGRLTPEELGLEPVPFEALAGGGRADNARLFRAILAGKERGPRADHLALNAGAALVVAGRAGDVAEGIEQARELVASGAVLARFEAYREASRALAGDGK
jgi:anthranilate phosphoribosyltransferase